MQEVILFFLNNNEIPIKATFYQAHNNRKNISILYLHGGGLVYGHKDDLPEEYIQLFLGSGYDLIMLDYLLAPESPLEEIITTLETSINHFTTHIYKDIGLTASNYVLFGRSAGSYLALLAAKRNNIMRPAALILFYGYSSLSEAFFSTPNSHFLTMPTIPHSLITAIIRNKPLTNGPIQKRYALYIYARQTGTWLSLIAPKINNEALSSYTLTDGDFKNLPPAFLAASTTDFDVPFEMSKMMSEAIPSSHLHLVQNSDHDFDRNPKDKQAKEAYLSLLSWLKKGLWCEK